MPLWYDSLSTEPNTRMIEREQAKIARLSPKRIAIVEDDEAISDVIREEVERRGLVATTYNRAETFIAAVRSKPRSEALEVTPDAVMLDLGLPDISGVQLLRRVGDLATRVPFLVLSSWHDIEYRRECLRLGASDFVAKPFDLEEVMLRLERLLVQRLERDLYSQDLVRIGSGFLHCQFKVLTDPMRGEASLSHMETKLLRKLAENKGDVVARELLFAEVWRYGEGAVSRTLDVYVSRLRRILQQSLSRAPLIENMRGEGYRLRDAPSDFIEPAR